MLAEASHIPRVLSKVDDVTMLTRMIVPRKTVFTTVPTVPASTSTVILNKLDPEIKLGHTYF